MIDPIRNQAGEVTGYVGVQYDISAYRSAIQHHQTAEQLLASIVDGFPGYIFRRAVDQRGAIHYPYFSGAVFRMLGLPPETDWSNGQFIKYIHPDDIDNVQGTLIRSSVNSTPFRSEYRLVAPAGQVYWFRAQSTPQKMPDGTIVWNGVAVDITAEKAAGYRLAYLVDHDALTGLPNRQHFRTLLAEAVAAARLKADHLAVFSIDLDDFQATNDEFGSAFGDECLRTICRRLRDLADLPNATLARLGGDEFAVLLPAIPIGASLLGLAEQIRSCIAQPVIADGNNTRLEACVGAAAFSVSDPGLAEGSKVWTEMKKRAHLALQSAKQAGPGSCRLYSAEYDDRVHNLTVLRRSLQRGLDEEQFELHYQPLVDLASSKVIGAEALVRWNHPELGLQRPDLFIPVAESTGLIVPLGRLVLCAALRQAKAWQQRYGTKLSIAVNLSSVQLQRPGFIAAVEQALTDTGADARTLEFEMTEGTLIEATDEIQEQLQALKRLGFGLTIDDFGTGHSTFKYLQQFPFDKVKIDQSFVRHLVIDSNEASIIRAMISLTHNLNLKVVAEGIETVMQRDFLRDESCDIGQGYLFSPPMAAEDFGWLLESGLTLPRPEHAINGPT